MRQLEQQDDTESPSAVPVASPVQDFSADNVLDTTPVTVLDTKQFLRSFQNDINPSSVASVEKRPDGVAVIHCTNNYEYLRFGYREDTKEIAKIKQYEDILIAFSYPHTVESAMKSLSALPEDERNWILDKLNADGSAVPVIFENGERKGLVMMNDAPVRRMLNKDKPHIAKSKEQIRAYDEAYKRTLEHEVRHVEYFEKYGRDLESWRHAFEALRPFTPAELKKYHVDRLTKDEIAAHIENEVIQTETGIQINWNGIIKNLQKPDYCDSKIFITEQDKLGYKNAVYALVNIAKNTYAKTKSVDKVMEELFSSDVGNYFIEAV